MTDNSQKSSALTALFTAYPPGQGENLDGLSAVYHMAIEGLPGWAVQRAIKAFIKGKVGDHNPTFRPRAPEISKEVEAQIFLECEKQNAEIVNQQKRLKDDGQQGYWRHRRNEIVTAATVDPTKQPAIPHEDFPALLEHRVDPGMQAKLAEVLPFKPLNTTQEAG
jgi:hypothetical protein